MNLAAGAQVPIVLNVVTATNSMVPLARVPDARHFGPPVPLTIAGAWHGFALWMLLMLSPILAWASAARRQSSPVIRFAQTGAMAILVSIGLVACFGNGTAPLPPVGTTTGSYTIRVAGTFTGTGGSTTRNVQVTLVVQ